MEKKQGSTKKEMLEVGGNTGNYDLTSFHMPKSVQKTKAVGEVGVISIINSDNGKRITLSSELMEKLNNPEKLQLAFGQEAIAISQSLSEEANSFTIRKSGSKGILYSSKLVDEITEEFGLDFTNRTSITLHEVAYSTNGDYTVAIVSMSIGL